MRHLGLHVDDVLLELLQFALRRVARVVRLGEVLPLDPDGLERGRDLRDVPGESISHSVVK